jgi:hypothetical protein
MRTIVVSPVLDDPFASGLALREAYDSVTDARPQNPVLIKLEPGTYDIGASPLELNKNAVHFEGSGRDATTITGSGFVVLMVNASANLSRFSIMNFAGDGLSVFSGFVELREVGIQVSTAGSFAMGIRYAFSGDGRMKDVIVNVENPAQNAIGVSILSDLPSPFVLEDVTVLARAPFRCDALEIGSSALMNDVAVDSRHTGISIIATGSFPDVTVVNSRIGGATSVGVATISNGASRLTIQSSSIQATFASVFLDSSSQATVRIADSLLSSQVVLNPPNTVICFGAYDSGFRPLDASCAPGSFIP